MRNKKILVFYLVIILVGVAIYFVITNRSNFSNKSSNVSTSPLEQGTLSTQTATIGNVMYKITPKGVSKASSSWDFEIELDTHAGSLDQDLVSQVRLSDGKNDDYQAVKWEGDPPGGHHRKGVLKFQPLGSNPISMMLKINLGKGEETSLTWELK